LACIQRLEFVQLDQSEDGRFLVLETKLNNLSGRLTAWGWACGLHDPQTYDKRLDTHPRVTEIKKTLQVISEQVAEKTLTAKYGLKYREGRSRQIISLLRLRKGGAATNRVFNADQSTSQAPKSNSGPQLEIVDGAKFDMLLTCLRQFIEDLEAFTRDLQISKQQRHYLDACVESISDLDVLTRIENARVGPDDPVSDAASVRLSLSIKGHSSCLPSLIPEGTAQLYSYAVCGWENAR